LVLETNGRITAHVLHPVTGQLVGMSTEPQLLPLVPFALEPGTAIEVPLWVGTASVDPRLGFTVPPGSWSAQGERAID
jgi:hypothetical protein